MEESILISRFAVTAPCLVDYGMHIGTRIRKARVEAGLEQAELAERIGVSPNTVWKWEAQQAAPRSALVEKLAAALGKPVGWLYGEGTSEVTIAGVAVSGPAEKLAAIVAALNAGDPPRLRPPIYKAPESIPVLFLLRKKVRKSA